MWRTDSEFQVLLCAVFAWMIFIDDAVAVELPHEP